MQDAQETEKLPWRSNSTSYLVGSFAIIVSRHIDHDSRRLEEVYQALYTSTHKHFVVIAM